MGVLAPQRMLLVLILGLAGPVPCYAQGLYGLSGVDYFQMKRAAAGVELNAPLWEENGQSPAPVVVALLEDPGERTARQYLEWNRLRLKKLAEAQRAIDAEVLRMEKEGRR